MAHERELDRPKLGRYALSISEVESLAKGGGAPAVINRLAASQRFKRKLLLAAVWNELGRANAAALGLARAALTVLVAVEEADPEVARSVHGHPYLDHWASSWLALSEGEVDAHAGMAVNYLATLAAAAAARARLPFQLTVSSADGTVVLPTLGACGDLGAGVVRIVGAPDRLTFAGPGGTVDVPAPYALAGPQWEPVRHVPLDAGYRIAIEDLETYRDCYPWTPQPRLDEPAAQRFADDCRVAWALIAREFPEHADGMRAALVSLTPLAPDSHVESQGATSFRAFGSLAVSLDAGADALALSLIHEFMHMKLVAVLDLYDLYLEGGAAKHFAPWRIDPRPVPALLHGAYAHFGVCDYWRRRRNAIVELNDPRPAHFEFALWRRLTLLAVDALLASEELTELGETFVTPMREQLERWASEPVPPEIDRAAEDVAHAYTVRWRMTHRPAEREALRQVARAPRPPWLPEALDPDGPARPDGSAAIAPGAAEPVVATLIRAAVTGTGAVPADPILAGAMEAHLARHWRDAAGGCGQVIAKGDLDGWVGLFVALYGQSSAAAGEPNLVRLVYAAARGAAQAADVFAWVGAVLAARADDDRQPVRG